METQSLYEVTDLATQVATDELVTGAGQAPIRALRKKYPYFTKFVLRGFQINTIFVPIKFRHR